MKWFKIETWDYMDVTPCHCYRLFTDEQEAKAWEKYMMENYSGGTTRVLRPASKAEILKCIEGMSLDELTLKNINNDEYYDPNYNTLLG